MDTILASGQTIFYQDHKILPYTNAVIHEVQRLSNIVAIGMPRYCAKNIVVRQFHFQKVNGLSLNLPLPPTKVQEDDAET